jgi:hypothetical protein
MMNFSVAMVMDVQKPMMMLMRARWECDDFDGAKMMLRTRKMRKLLRTRLQKVVTNEANRIHALWANAKTAQPANW